MRSETIGKGGRRIVFFLLLSISLSIHAYRKDLIFDYLGVKEGLSQGTVWCILKDHKGYIWFGTVDGLNRYDGLSFMVFHHDVDDPKSLSSSSVNYLFEDRERNLWIATDKGLNRMETGVSRFRRFQHNPKDPQSLISDSVQAISQDTRGNIWVGTDLGLDCLTPGSDRFIHYRPDAADPGAIADRSIRFVLADRQGRIWIGFGEKGVDCFLPDRGRFIHHHQDPGNPASLPSGKTRGACLAGDCMIWISHADRWLSRIDPGTGGVERYDLGEEAAGLGGISTDSNGNIWTASGNGLFFMNPATREVIHLRSDLRFPSTLITNSINSVYVDETDILWAGSSYFGVNKANLRAKRFINYTHDPTNPDTLGFSFIRGIYETPNAILYIGGQGFDRLDRKKGSWRHFSKEQGNPLATIRSEVFTLCPNSSDPQSLLWIGTNGDGLFMFDPRNQTIRPYSPPGVKSRVIYGLYKDAAGFLWIGTDDGLYRHDVKKKETRAFDLTKIAGFETKRTSVSGTYWMMHDHEGILWVGSRGYGVFSFDARKNQWRNYIHDPDNPRSLSSDLVTSILETRAGELWVSTYGGGINHLNRDRGTFERYTSRKGLANDVVYGMLEDEHGLIWLSTNLGLCRFNSATGVFRSYTEKDGLNGNEFNTQSFFKNPRTGELFFGGTNGLNAFFSEEIPDDPHPPIVILEDLKIFNRSVSAGPDSILKKPINETDFLSLSYRDSMLTFEFNGLHYAAPSKNRFAYLLEGFDHDWNYTGAQRRYATYTNLNPGRYTLRIKAANSDGVWSGTGKTLKIHIAPPFWKTWWFQLFSLVFILFLLFAFYRFRVRELQKRKAELEQEVAERTLELKEMSLSDPMTNLRNRRYVSEVMMTEIDTYLEQRKYVIEKGQRRKTVLPEAMIGILLIDVDYFKKVNDRHGHKAGDLFLNEFAQILRNCVRRDDVVVRWGGEEFLLILKNCDPTFLPSVSEKIRKAVEQNEFLISPAENLKVRSSCCIGIVQFPLIQNHPLLISFDQSIVLADMAMYLGKEGGRNRTVHLEHGSLIPEGDISEYLTSSEVLKHSGLVKITEYSSQGASGVAPQQ